MTKQELELALNKNGDFNPLKMKAVSSLLGKVIFRIEKIIFGQIGQGDFPVRPIILNPEILSSSESMKPAGLYFTLNNQVFIPVPRLYNFEEASQAVLFIPNAKDGDMAIEVNIDFDSDNSGLILSINSEQFHDPTDLSMSCDTILFVGFQNNNGGLA